MALIVEDGTIVADAVSYATVAEARTYAEKRGLTLSATDAVVEKLLVLACDYLQSLEAQFKGVRVDTDQELAWPRQLVYVFGFPDALASDTIPKVLKDAQCQLAYDASQMALQPTGGTAREVIMKQVDVLVTQWAATGSTNLQPIFNKALGILAPLLRATGGLTTIRV